MDQKFISSGTDIHQYPCIPSSENDDPVEGTVVFADYQKRVGGRKGTPGKVKD
jgi:hypothetical protein